MATPPVVVTKEEWSYISFLELVRHSHGPGLREAIHEIGVTCGEYTEQWHAWNPVIGFTCARRYLPVYIKVATEER